MRIFKKTSRQIFYALLGISLLSLMLAQLANAQSPIKPLLNSEMIQKKYGNYGLKVLKTSLTLRISDLYSSQDGVKTTRTLAFVIFPDVIDERVRAEHSLITEKSQSIGSTFKQSGWDVKKQNRYFGTMTSVPAAVKKLMGEIPDKALAVHIYELFVAKEGKSIHYCTIAEIHHPDYLTLADLSHLYGKVTESSNQNVTPIDQILEFVNVQLKEINE